MKKARLLVTAMFAALAFSAAACSSPTAPDDTDHVIGSGNHVIGSGNHVIGSGNHIIGSGN
jgi:hypothetical protein